MNKTRTASRSHPESRKKVLFLTTWYPDPGNPVSGIFVREHARAASLADDVVVIHLQGNDPGLRAMWKMEAEPDETLSQGINTYRITHRLSPIPKTSIFINIYSAFQAFHRLNRMGFRPDVLHAHTYKAGLPAMFIGKRFKIPVIVTEHNTAFPRKLMNKAEIRIARLVFSQAAAVLPVSASLRESIRGYGIQANYRLVPNVVDTALFTPPDSPGNHSPVRLLFVGRLDEVKGLPYLFESLSGICPQRSEWLLDVVGDGPERDAYAKLVSRVGLESHIIFHGTQPKTVVARLMRNADLFVLPSLWENLPCVLLEAMASGLPVVSTQIGGIPEIIDPDTGVLVPPGDSQALAASIQGMIDGGFRRFNRQEIARKAQRFSPQAVGEMLHSIYQEVLRT